MLIISILVIGVLVHACLNYKFTVAYASIMFALVFLWDGSLPNVESFSTKNLVSIAISTTIFMILYLNKRNRDQLNRRKAHFRNADDVNLYPNAEVPTSHELMIAHDCEQKDDSSNNYPEICALNSDRLDRRNEAQLSSSNDCRKGSHKEYHGILRDFGVAHYQFKPQNRRSYYVRIDEDIIWGLGLADAIANSTVQKGDFITLKKEREEVVEYARIIDESGNRLGSEKLASPKRRSFWLITTV